jgi:CheY-like chemotaxis protein
VNEGKILGGKAPFRHDFDEATIARQFRLYPIIAVTSYALNGEEKIAKAAGCDDYVPKPYSPRELLAKIRQHLS